jgi:hypothetical protein
VPGLVVGSTLLIFQLSEQYAGESGAQCASNQEGGNQ